MSNKCRAFYILFALLCLPHITQAEEPRFIFPADCIYGDNCWAVNYVDVDPKDDVIKDFKCTRKSYDGHKGTDFALGSITHMNQGVNVFAAADGRVLRVRDGENDIIKTEDELASIKENTKECGNGVLIDHGNGLQTIYCHLKEESIIVKPQDIIKTGDIIAQIGQSGLAEFPHLHFGVIWEGGMIDPYTGHMNTEGCGKMKQPLWRDANITYDPVAIFNGGFRSQSPDFNAIEHGENNPETLSMNNAAFVFWVGFYNVEKNDAVTLKILDPDGVLFVETNQTVEQTRARQYYFTGRKIGRVQLKEGTYKGIVNITRNNKNGTAVTRTKEYTIRVHK